MVPVHAGEVHVVCGTVAFGMGVDKADVRFVAHWNVSASLTAYAQEVGRAGRDGCVGECMLLYSQDDVASMVSCIENTSTVSTADRAALSALCVIQRWCLDDMYCRHATLAAYFAAGAASLAATCNNMCDNCDTE
jgi:superfamily II DNA helicase RecQ